MVLGQARFTSQMFSNRWNLHAHDELIATMVRDSSRHMSRVTFADGIVMDITPSGWGTVVATVDDDEWGRIERTSWWGRSWEITARGFAATLTSDPLPRRWSIRIGSEPIGRLSGGRLSYNRLDITSDISTPATVLILAWHILARPWEQAAAPGSLVRR